MEPYSSTEDLLCPVCNEQLSGLETPVPPKSKKSRKTNKIKQGGSKSRSSKSINTTKSQGDQSNNTVGNGYQEIVIAKCGHLFHKLCLKHYCFFAMEGKSSHSSSKVNCPWCNMQISSMAFQIVDYRAHQDKSTIRDRDFNKTNIMNNELSGQVKTAKESFQRVSTEVEGEKQNHEIYSIIQKELKNIEEKKMETDSLFADIDRSEQMFKFMLSQQLKIVRRFITKMKEKLPKDFIHFPRCLAPFLEIIEGDDRLVRDLGEIIVPIHLNHLNTDRHSLLQGIFATVCKKLKTLGKPIDITEAVITEHLQLKNSDETSNSKAISNLLTSRCKSSASVLSSGNLTALARESIQQIVQNIDVLFSTSIKDDKTRSTRCNRKDNLSTSDMEIIYQPRRSAEDLASEFCKTYDYEFEA